MSFRYREKDDDSSDDDIWGFESDNDKRYHDSDDDYHNAYEDDAVNDLSKKLKEKARLNRIIKNNKYSDSDLNRFVWESIVDHTEERIEASIRARELISNMDDIQNRALYQDASGPEADTSKKYNTRTRNGLEHCVKKNVRLNECTHIHAAHVLGIHTKNMCKELRDLVEKTNPLPACYNIGPDKCMDNFCFEIIQADSKEDLEVSKQKFIKQINKDHYPDKIKEMLTEMAEKVEFNRKNIRFNN